MTPKTSTTRRSLPAALAARALAPVTRAAAAGVALRRRDDAGQTTAEYGLVILAAGGIALGVIAWASGTGSFTDLFESVVDSLSDSL